VSHKLCQWYTNSNFTAAGLRALDIDEETDDNVVDQDLGDERIKDNTVLASYFETLQKRLSKENKPKEYEQGTFWVLPPQPFFALRQSRSPSQLYHPRVFLWLPHLLVSETLKCPDCKSNLRVKGWNTEPRARRIVDLKE
jgi:hypothetical protein